MTDMKNKRLTAEERIGIRNLFIKKTKKFSKAELAKLLNLERTTLYLYEYKLRVPSSSTAIKLQKFIKKLER